MEKPTLKLYNTLTKKLEEFVPLNPPKVTMYVCGITAYDSPHLGHIRSAVVFDVLYRVLEALGYEVIYVRNITDIDDKIINRSNREGIFWKDLVEKYVKEYEKAIESLNLLKPTYTPKASEHIPEIIYLIQRLIEKGLAYQSNGDVYFRVEKFPYYGKLSGRKIDELLAGVRIEVSEKKEHPLDFALWKAAKPGEPFWESPWGLGRPGWHIECSAMALKYLGETIDLHGGGLDLIFPHHENEIAQSEGTTGKPFVRYFVHHGLITINGEKMSKSLGNFVTMDWLFERFHPEVIKTFLLSMHYRSPLDYSEESLKNMEKAVYGFYETLYWAEKAQSLKEGLLSEKARRLEKAYQEFKNKFFSALLDDLNTAMALGYLFGLERELYNFVSKTPQLTSEEELLVKTIAKNLRDEAFKLLGLFYTDPLSFWKNERERKLKSVGITLEEVEKLIREREQARKEKNFEKADRIRTELQEKGILLKDTKTETFWWLE
ncbi:cysteine--tRNA ligase [Thermodesulfobacterium sp. TA1]|uniref:cysteine--tRNA ligase n=1 Tax=Thermodesulfobacterium sp. TA1 TaxID=2234087 RepID=UPI0012320063|nr:cysteine--tRNA ligase [Thermodesulfobacterium sp. TA1]QER41438.1 cysteine--tRNA ligase [Thermodesulfobacterium sp. TA1]